MGFTPLCPWCCTKYNISYVIYYIRQSLLSHCMCIHQLFIICMWSLNQGLGTNDLQITLHIFGITLIISHRKRLTISLEIYIHFVTLCLKNWFINSTDFEGESNLFLDLIEF